jgi:tetratricopeptide (TPR) repeat protein
MQSAARSEPEERIPRLASGWKSAGHQLSPAEGFLLSRIDGHTPWTQLRQIGGIPPEEVDRCLERWLFEGVVEISGCEQARPEERELESPADGSSESRIDPDVDLDPKLQQQILDFEASLDRPYTELLGVARDAGAQEIKRAYFSLSKVYHPDRYFRRELGDYAPRLERIFRKLVEAYELLSDPATRAEIERSLGAMPPPAREAATDTAREAATDTDRTVNTQAPPRKLTKRETLDRLRGHFKIPRQLVAERRLRAKQFFEAASVAAKRERWHEAVPSLRLAIAFDPWNDAYRASFADILSHYHEQRATSALESGGGSLGAEAQAEAFRLLEEVLIHRPADPEVNHRAAKLALDLREFDRAQEYAESACELCPDSVAMQLTLGRALLKSGLREKAKKILTAAALLDPDDREVKAELLQMRSSRRKT